ncbi:hypothetical protein [Ammoniphilus sp. YIM 78166]|uniref:hypothetical protein n=1 Tax=Ammoniphilus sp. YIM 78166 TaxID=1644106 RepID=UPI0010705722|nr:hypothetical protein [Ammoniphilus sp. YIM 78166]
MSLFPFDPIRYFQQLEREISRFLPDDLLTFGQIELHETDQHIFVACQLPGLKKIDEVEARIVREMYLQMIRKANGSYEVKQDSWVSSQQFTGTSQQSFQLPARVYSSPIFMRIVQPGKLEIQLLKKH